MAALFNLYCYSTVQQAAHDEISTGAIATSGGVAIPASYSVVSGNKINITYNYTPFGLGSSSTYSIERDYPACTTSGPTTNITGLDVADAVQLSTMIIFVWVSAWAIRSLRGVL